MLSPYQFQPNNPNSVNTGQHVQPGGGGGNTFANILGGLANAGLGYATGGLGGAAANILGGLTGGGAGATSAKPTSTSTDTSSSQKVDAAAEKYKSLYLSANQYIPNLGQSLTQMSSNDIIAPQAFDSSLQGEPVPYINPYKWEY